MGNICILGVGGAGCAIMKELINLEQVHVAVLNTDKQALQNSPVSTKLLLGPKTCGGLASNVPMRGKRAAEESHDEILGLIHGASMLVLIGGLGGGTASGAVPVIASMGKELGIPVLVAVTLAFTFESEQRRVATKALEELKTMGVSVFTNDLGEAEEGLMASQSMQTLLNGNATIIVEEVKRNVCVGVPV